MLPPLPQRLVVSLTELLTIEQETHRFLAETRPCWPAAGVARERLAEVERLAAAHIAALCGRLGARAASVERPRPPAPATRAPCSAHTTGSAILGDVYARLQRAVAGYTLMQPAAHRLCDSWVIADDGTAAHLGRRHAQEYLRAAGQIMAIIHDVVIGELDQDGIACHCTCPACSIGVCVCALTCRAIIAEPWLTARPPLAEHGIALVPPRSGSAAAAAPFLPGDVIVAVNGEPFDLLTTFQRLIRDNPPRQDVAFTVRRPAGDGVVHVEFRRQGADHNEDECVLPSGQHFYLAQARDARHRLRRRNRTDTTATGLAALSPREVQVLKLLVHGATNVVIADELEISRATVANHVANILRKLGLANRTEAAGLASHAGLFSDA